MFYKVVRDDLTVLVKRNSEITNNGYWLAEIIEVKHTDNISLIRIKERWVDESEFSDKVEIEEVEYNAFRDIAITNMLAIKALNINIRTSFNV